MKTDTLSTWVYIKTTSARVTQQPESIWGRFSSTESLKQTNL